MTNKHRVQGKFNELVGKVTDDKAKELKGITQNKYGHLKDKASELSDIEIDASEKTVISVVVGVLLIISGLYFLMRAREDE